MVLVSIEVGDGATEKVVGADRGSCPSPIVGNIVRLILSPGSRGSFGRYSAGRVGTSRPKVLTDFPVFECGTAPSG